MRRVKKTADRSKATLFLGLGAPAQRTGGCRTSCLDFGRLGYQSVPFDRLVPRNTEFRWWTPPPLITRVHETVSIPCSVSPRAPAQPGT